MCAENAKTYKTYCIQCRSLCAVECSVDDGKLVKIRPDYEKPERANVCPRGAAVPEIVYSPQRLRYPMVRTNPKGAPDPGWKRINWQDALELVVRKIREIQNKYGPEAMAFIRPAAGGSPSRDYGPLLFRLANALNTPNVVTPGHICMWHRDFETKMTYGVPLPLPDFDNSKFILLFGINPAETWPSFFKALKRAKENGAQIVMIDPRKTETARFADHWYAIRPGSDGALVLGLIHIFIAEQLYDRDFVVNWTNAPFLVREDKGTLLKTADLGLAPDLFLVWDAVRNQPVPVPENGVLEGIEPVLDGSWEVEAAGGKLRCTTVWNLLKAGASEYDPQTVESLTWIQAETIKKLAHMMAENHPVSYFSYNGIEQSTNASYTSRALCVLYALTGDFDKKGGNLVVPEVPFNHLNGASFLSPPQSKKRLGRQKRPIGPAAEYSVTAYDFYNAVLNDDPYPVRGLLGIGGNTLISQGDTLTGAEALKRLEFYVHIDMFPNPTSHFADLLLPVSSIWEGLQVRTSFILSPAGVNNLVQIRQQVINPLYESKPDEQIIMELAMALGFGDKFWQGDLEKAYNYMLEPSGLTMETLKENPGGVLLLQEQEYQKYRKNGFKTPTGKLEIFATIFKDHGYEPLPVYEEQQTYTLPEDVYREYPLILITAKLRNYGLSQHRGIPALRKLAPDPFVEVHPLTAQKYRVEDGEWVYLATPEGKIRVQVRVTSDIPERVVCTQFGWWQPCPELDKCGYDAFSAEGSNINLITSNKYQDPISGSVPHKCYPCTLARIQAE